MDVNQKLLLDFAKLLWDVVAKVHLHLHLPPPPMSLVRLRNIVSYAIFGTPF